MKKLLLSTAAVGLVFAAAPAQAEIDLDLGGYFLGYAAIVDQDDRSTTSDDRDFDILRNTEIHISGETTLDNGLTVGFHTEVEADGDYAETNTFEESYIYMSGGWGRVNVGAEDGAAYLLQVAAPAADNYFDGIRQLVQPVNYTVAEGTVAPATAALGSVDYDQDATLYEDKVTYLSPVLNGFQLGLSYTPDTEGAPGNTTGVRTDGVADAMGEAYDVAVRYEGQFNNVGVTAGAGFTHIELEKNGVPAVGAALAATTNYNSDDRQLWNVGLDLDIGPFGIGAIYMEDDYADTVTATSAANLVTSVSQKRDEEETFVVGVDYTTGPFKLGASYLDQDGTNNVAGNTGNDGVETQRYTGGVTYTYGPGMTFRGSISYIEHDNVSITGSTADDIDATSVLLGTAIKF